MSKRNLPKEIDRFLKDNLYTMTPKQLHELTGVSFFTIYKRLKGKTPYPVKKEKIESKPEKEIIVVQYKQEERKRPPALYSNKRLYDQI